jgi:20S proteasome subunit beta 3
MLIFHKERSFLRKREQNNTKSHSYNVINMSNRFGPWFVEPVIAGLDKENRPFICSTDLIGCINFAKDFVVSGTTSNQLYGMCESLWEPDLVRPFFRM